MEQWTATATVSWRLLTAVATEQGTTGRPGHGQFTATSSEERTGGHCARPGERNDAKRSRAEELERGIAEGRSTLARRPRDELPPGGP